MWPYLHGSGSLAEMWHGLTKWWHFWHTVDAQVLIAFKLLEASSFLWCLSQHKDPLCDSVGTGVSAG